MDKLNKFLRRNAFTLILVLGFAIYVIVAGVTKSCPSCTAITGLLGLNREKPAMASEDRKIEWSAYTLSGERISSDSLSGKIVLIDFWATWCPPCRKGIPEFIELQNEYGEDGLIIVGVSLDKDGSSVVEQFAKEYGIQYPLVMADASLLKSFGRIESIPTTFLIDRQGRLVDRRIGYTRKKTFVKMIDSLDQSR